MEDLNECNIQRVRELHEEAVRMAEAKTEFLSRMSHDMRTPMNGILGMAALSEDETDLEVLKQNMAKIRTAGEYLLGLINDILDSQKIESGRLQLHPQVVDGMGFIEDMLDMVRRFADEKDINFQVDIAKEGLDGYVRLDPIRTKQICLNLLSNAIKFTPEHGTVQFQIKGFDRPGNLRHVVVHVKDTGVGMSEEFLRDGIYKSFSQEYNALSSKNVSTGLGLSIVKRLIEMMSGTIEVESELGKGTEFRVSFDLERVQQVAAARLAGDDTQKYDDIHAVLKGRRILLVEDQPLNAEVAKRLLSKMGCEVTWAENGKLGVEAFEASELNYYDAVLMDIRMPVMNGLQSAKGIRSLHRPDSLLVPILAMTANAYDEDVRASLDAGMNDHLAKPIEPQKLYETLAQFISEAGESRMEFYSYRLDSAAMRVMNVDIAELKALVQSGSDTRGAFSVKYDAFYRIHEFLSRNSSRLQHGTQIVLFTIEGGDESGNLYHELATAVKHSLRAGDLLLEFNDSQIVALLVNCDAENGAMVVNRIMDSVNRDEHMDADKVRFEISEL